MKKSRVFVAAGIALLATGVLAACGSSNHLILQRQKIMAIFIQLTQKLWITSFQGNKVLRLPLQMVSMVFSQTTSMGT